MENAELAAVVLSEEQVLLDTEPTLRDVSQALVADYGTDYGSPWIPRFTDVPRRPTLIRVYMRTPFSKEIVLYGRRLRWPDDVKMT